MYDDLSSSNLKERGASYQCINLNSTVRRFVIVNRLCAVDEVIIDDPNFVAFASMQPGGTDSFMDSVVMTRLATVNCQRLRLTTVNCTAMVTPDDKVVTGETNAGQMDLECTSYRRLKAKTNHPTRTRRDCPRNTKRTLILRSPVSLRPLRCSSNAPDEAASSN